MVNFGGVLRNWNLRPNRVTGHVNFNRTKMMQNAKIQKLVENAEIENYMRHFLVIFKQCASLYLSKYA